MHYKLGQLVLQIKVNVVPSWGNFVITIAPSVATNLRNLIS